MKGLVVNLPSSKALTLFWNFGSILGIILVFQIFTGVFLSIYFIPDRLVAFDSVQYIMLEVNYGWVFRIFHFNGARLFFIFLYLHFFKGLFFCSYRLKFVWVSGLLIFLLVIIEAFIGYVLVWAQISFWASVVITSLLSVIPFWGPILVVWIWSGFSVGCATLKFFFVIHFLLPWLIFVFVVFHLFFLHETGRSSKLYCHGDYDKVSFFPFYILKDIYNILFFMSFFIFVFVFPFVLGDPEIFVESDPMTSPVHIVPEWYFLFAYAILRAIPNKVMGVIALLMRILIFFFFVFVDNYTSVLVNLNKTLVFLFFFVGVFLSWLGQCHVEFPFTLFRIIFSSLYFFLILVLFLCFFLSFFVFK